MKNSLWTILMVIGFGLAACGGGGGDSPSKDGNGDIVIDNSGGGDLNNFRVDVEGLKSTDRMAGPKLIVGSNTFQLDKVGRFVSLNGSDFTDIITGADFSIGGLTWYWSADAGDGGIKTTHVTDGNTIIRFDINDMSQVGIASSVTVVIFSGNTVTELTPDPLNGPNIPKLSFRLRILENGVEKFNYFLWMEKGDRTDNANFFGLANYSFPIFIGGDSENFGYGWTISIK